LIGVSKEDAEQVVKLNGFTFAGSILEILPDSNEPSADAQTLKMQLQQFLGGRYVTESKLLKLNLLSQDPTITQAGFLETAERAEKMFKALMKVCDELFKTRKEKQAAIESISVAGNNIDNSKQIVVLADTFPDLLNLDLRENQIPSTESLKAFKNRFRMLKTIYIAGNPIETKQPGYHAELLEWFPTLSDINGAKVRTPEQVAAAVEAARPKPIPQGGPDFRDTHSIGEAFLVDFFSSYDNDRAGLLSRYYDESSHISLAVDVNSVRDPKSPLPLPWAAYLKFSRNLTRITHLGTRMQRLFKGAGVVAELWANLPQTRHPDIKQEMGKYIMDCHVLSGLADPSGAVGAGVDGMIITVHGEFEEFDAKSGSTGKRSFSRTFVLGPGKPNRNPIRVVSDMLSLRAWNSLPDTARAGDATSQQGAMVVELSKQTGMTAEYAKLCLEDASVCWDFSKALVVFNEKRVSCLFPRHR
jgi:nuclear RNA export factor